MSRIKPAGPRCRARTRSLTLLAAAACAGAALATQPFQATSADASWRLRGDGSRLELRDGQAHLVKRYELPASDAGAAPTVASVHHAALRRSFVVTFRHLPQVWEISLDPQAEPLYQGLVHDFRMGEGVAEPGFLGVRRMRMPVALPDSTLDSTGSYLLGRAADGADGRAVLHLVHLDVRRSIARFECDADPDLAAARPGEHGERALIVVPDRLGGPPLVVDLDGMRLLDAATLAVRRLVPADSERAPCRLK
jgi:hypothetical protein